MRHVAYASRLYHASGVVFVVAFGVAFFLFWKNMPLIPMIIGAFLVGAIVLGCMRALISSRPLIVADENGLACYRNFLSAPIDWADIVAIRHVPRREQRAHGKTSFVLLEAWRPVEVTIRNRDKYLARFPKLLRKAVSHSENPDWLVLRIDYAGHTGTSAELLRCIRHYTKLEASETN